MTFPVFLAGASQSDALVERDIIADDRSLADDDTHSVVDKQAASDFGCGVNLDSGQQAGDLGKPAGHEEKVVVPEPVVHAVEPHRVETGVAEKDFQARLGSGIVLHHVGHVFPD